MKRRRHWCSCHCRHEFSNFFVYCDKFAGSFEYLFDEYGPIWIIEPEERRNTRYKLTKNPRLASINFQKVIPPYQAYQSLRMWLSNKAMPNKPIPEISNKDMIVAKGFDLKTSFRNPKDKNKIRKDKC
jgi:hypothetical protein